ncbi:30S ribosomal protein S15 [Candidatus Dependentiae bacterium]|nr:30S ribosomal protein S15 [Candidatus Dependentiae bacterium]
MLNREKKKQLVEEFGQSEKNTGAIEVQVAMLTERIHQLTEHLKENHKDFSSKRGLLKMVSQRRTFLQYLKKTDAAKYTSLIERLHLKK